MRDTRCGIWDMRFLYLEIENYLSLGIGHWTLIVICILLLEICFKLLVLSMIFIKIQGLFSYNLNSWNKHT